MTSRKPNSSRWIEQTLAGLSTGEKVGQLFCLLGNADETEDIDYALKTVRPGGFMLAPGTASAVQSVHREVQMRAKVPLLLAANLESGGNGIALEGTDFGAPLLVASGGNAEAAYQMGLVSGREGRAVGCNWAFAPVIDIEMNYLNPVTNSRTFGSEPFAVLTMATAFQRGMRDAGMAVTLKHFPGDGTDERDQHLVTAINSMGADQWMKTYGSIYKALIADGAEAVMAAHIALPEIARELGADEIGETLFPASLSKTLNRELLRNRLGFKGLIVTDASPMIGFTSVMSRHEAVPASIAAGCDMFLFTQNLDEDVAFMTEGVSRGEISTERLDDAIRRILVLKEQLGLGRQQAEGALVPAESELEVIGHQTHKDWAYSCADRGITLVKNEGSLLPLRPANHQSILLHTVKERRRPQSSAVDEIESLVIRALTAAGLKVTRLVDTGLLDGAHPPILTEAVSRLREDFDLALYLAFHPRGRWQTTVRLDWSEPRAADAPVHVRDIPTVFVSFANPYHLRDVPGVSAFVNCYGATTTIAESLVEKLLGRSTFKGRSPIDPFAGIPDVARPE